MKIKIAYQNGEALQARTVEETRRAAVLLVEIMRHGGKDSHSI